jgi:tetratricopeptide (TPR) repeat protein
LASPPTRAPARFSLARGGGLLAACLIVLATLAVYVNSFSGTFVFDDVKSIKENPSIQQSISESLHPPRNGETVSGRPVLNLTLAVNFAMGGLDTWGYHATNVLIHILSALALMGILRRTFELPRLKSQLGDAALGLAVTIALLWAIHPLQTESVTYVVQRAESLAGLFYLLTFYCVIRGATSERGLGWHVAAVAACWLGAGAKETLSTAPLLILLYDCLFLGGSLRQTLRRRWGLYVGLAVTWIWLAVLVKGAGLLMRRTELGVIDAWSYAVSQPGVILHYLRLSLWPHPLCLDYGWPVAGTLGIIVPGVLVVVLLAASVWGMLDQRRWGFAGAWFFLILAPSSSIVPLGQLAFEHRMYLSLAAVVTLVVVGVYVACHWLVGRQQLVPRVATAAGVCLVVSAGVVLGALTVLRNQTYRSELSIWRDTVAKAPDNPTANYNLAVALGSEKLIPEAIEYYERAIRLNRKPDKTTSPKVAQDSQAMAAYNCGLALANLGRRNEAVERYELAIQLNPEMARAHYNCGIVLAELGRSSEAIAHYQEALHLKPDYFEVHNYWGSLLLGMGRTAEAVGHYQKSLEITPNATAHNNLGMILQVNGQLAEAADHFRQAVRLKPDYVRAHFNLVITLAQMGRVREAIETGSQADKSLPDQWQVKAQVAWLLATRDPAEGGNPQRALELADRAVQLSGRREVVCLETLAAACASAGRFEEAMALGVEAGRLAQSTGQKAVLARIEKQLHEYRNRKPYRESLVASKP